MKLIILIKGLFSSSKEVLVYLFLGFLPLSVNLILAPFYTNIFDTDQYALLGLGSVFMNFFSVFVACGLQGAFSRFYFDKYSKSKLKDALLSTVLILIFLIFILLFIILQFFGDPLLDLLLDNVEFTYSEYGKWLVINSLTSVINAVLLSYFRNEENVKAFAAVSLSFFISSLTGNLIGVFALELGAYGSIAGRSIGSALITIPSSFIYLLKVKFLFRKKWIKPLFKFGLPLVPYGFLVMLYENVDKLLMEKLFDMNSLGAYTLAYQVSGILSVFIFAIFNTVSPKLNKVLIRNKGQESISLIIERFIIASLVIIVFGNALANPLIKIFINESFHQILDYLPILMVGYVGRAFYLIFSIFLLFYHRNSTLSYFTTISVVLGLVFSISLKGQLGVLSIYIGVLTMKLSQAFLAVESIRKFKDFNIRTLRIRNLTILSTLLIITAFSKVVLPGLLGEMGHFFPSLVFIFFLIVKWSYTKSLFYP